MIAALCVWAALALAFTLATLLRVRTRGARAPAAVPPLLMLRPVDAPTALELLNLSAPLPPGVEQIVISPQALTAAPGLAVLRSDPQCANRKVGHLLAALARLGARPRVAIVDADVRVTPELLASLGQALDGGAALATAAPWPRGGRGVGASALHGLLAHGHQDFRAQDAMHLGAKAICGKAMLLGPDALAELPALADCLGEDLELAVRLHRCGLRVALAEAPAVTPLAERVPLPALLARMTRWMQVLRSHRPGLAPTVPLLIAPTPLLLALALATRAAPLALAVLALALGRTALSVRLCPCRRAPYAWLLGELVLVAAALRALVRRDVEWRGRRLRLLAGGRAAVLP